MIPAHFARELADVRRHEFEQRAAIERLGRHAARCRPSRRARVRHLVDGLLGRLRPASGLRAAPSASGVECCACAV